MAINMDSLSLEDDDGVTFSRAGQRGADVDVQLCLAGRFLTDRTIRSHMMKERMAEVWRPVKGVSIREVSLGMFLFQFFHKIDMEKVLGGGPWTFDNHILVLGRMRMGVPLQEIVLNHVDFWIQIHNLPIGFMSEFVGRTLGNYIGEFLDYDPNNDSCVWRTYMRIRVKVDVRQPLKKDRKVIMEGGDWCLVSVQV